MGGRRRYRGLRRFFLVLFLAATVLVFLTVATFEASSGNGDNGALSSSGFATTLALLTSVTSLIGWVSTTALAWRKDRRDAVRERAQLDLEDRRLTLEEEKLALEREKLHRADPDRGGGQ